ncbi:MAG: hypothetical protein WDM90_21340 [Ferruginibacter sp.]
MKTNKLLSVAAIFTLTIVLFSCKKQQVALTPPTTDIETTFELSSDQAIADNLMEDANNTFMEAAADKNLLGSNSSLQPLTTNNILRTAIVTVTPAVGFPKTIVIDFGNGTISPNGISRVGKINIVLSDSVRKTGSKAVFTFTNYYVNKFKKEGTLTWTNTSTATTKSWQRKIDNGKVTAPNGSYWLHNGIRDVVQIAGANTPNNLLDDIFLITGNHTVTNAAGKTRNCYITEALQKKTTCDNICTGKLMVEGGANNAVIDFGHGDCDKTATVYINGQEPRTVALQ